MEQKWAIANTARAMNKVYRTNLIIWIKNKTKNGVHDGSMVPADGMPSKWATRINIIKRNIICEISSESIWIIISTILSGFHCVASRGAHPSMQKRYWKKGLAISLKRADKTVLSGRGTFVILDIYFNGSCLLSETTKSHLFGCCIFFLHLLFRFGLVRSFS